VALTSDRIEKEFMFVEIEMAENHEALYTKILDSKRLRENGEREKNKN
jgi:hypothetical protein